MAFIARFCLQLRSQAFRFDPDDFDTTTSRLRHRRQDTQLMLPDFRFLFATVVLAVSVLIFGLGAAALLRAAHEEFVSLPSWRLAQQPLLAPQFEMNAPTLAMLRIEAPAPRSMVENTRPHVLQTDAPRLEAVHPEPVRDQPPVQPEAVATPVAIATPETPTEPPVSVAEPSAPATEPVADAPAGETPPVATTQADTPAQHANPASENMSDAHATEAAAPETQEPEAKPAILASTENEASEPPETVGAITRSSEATATAVIPLPVARKPVRVNTRAAAQRRRAIARARAATRAAQQQQQRQAPDPFGLFGTPAPAPRS